MTEHNIDHDYWVQEGKGHDWTVWKPGLYHFTQRIFGKEYEIDTIPYIDDNNNDPSALKYNRKPEIDMYYNSSEQTITFQGNCDIKELSIYDLYGRLRLSGSDIQNNTLNINRLNSGVYFVVPYDGKRNLQGRKMVIF
jgi:hypothetical protein